ncbi:MAG TPA: hypothetical protein VI455_20340 [Terriglobia bacterium]
MKFVSRLRYLALLTLALGVPSAPVGLRGQGASAARKAAPLPPDQAAPTGGPNQPVYVYLYSRFTDHVNLELEEARLHRLLPALEKYRQDHPEAHVCATILFSGAMSRALAEANAKTGIKDYVLDFVRRGVIELGYDGTDEPTYEKRPVVDFSAAKTPEDRWLARETAAKELLTERRDPLTGAPQPGTSGGLTEMQEVFGNAVVINLTLNVASPFGATPGGAVTKAGERAPGAPPGSGVSLIPEVGDDRELAEQILQYSPGAIMFGLPEANPAHLPGFWASEAGFGRLVSPVPNSSPELYWQDNILRSTEGSDEVVRLVHGYDGVDGLKKVLSTTARSRVRIVHVEFGSEQDYVQPWWTKQGHAPLRYAYDHTEHPQLPPETVRPAPGVDAAFEKEDAAMKWLLEEFFPANPGSRFVSSTNLKEMTPPSTGFSVSIDGLRIALADMLRSWGNDTFPPPHLVADGHYLSLADLFQVMTDAFAEQDRTGKLPQSVQVVQVYGPLRTLMGHGPNAGEVTVADVARACAEIAPRLHDQTGAPVPKNFIPSAITVGGVNVNAAQFLRLMAAALVTPSQDAKLRVKMTYLFPGTAELTPKTRPMTEMGGAWTIKPAPLELPSASGSGQSGQAERRHHSEASVAKRSAASPQSRA